MTGLRRILDAVDWISEWSGKAAAFLLLPAVAVIAYEVTSRYVFDDPTLWATESVGFLLGGLYMLGGAYTHYIRGHINVETLYMLLPPRVRALVRLLVHFPLFALYVGVLVWVGWGFFLDSAASLEDSGSAWNPPIYPVKALLPLGATLMMLQGVSQVIRDILYLLGKGPPVE